MTILFHLIGITLSLGLSLAPVESDKPPLPYYDYDACPFDCCSYGVWTAREETVLRADHDDDSPVVSKVRGGEEVTGLTGVVITEESGKVRILRGLSMNVENSREEINLIPGDVIHDIRYVGEGYDKFYFNGVFILGRTNIRRVGKHGSWEVINLPQWVWWAKIGRRNGESGWTRELDHFDHLDACE